MGIIRILLILIAIAALSLVILPKITNEELFNKKLLRYLTIALSTMCMLLALCIYYFKDTLWLASDNSNLLSKNISYDAILQTKTLQLTAYDLQNFNSTTISSLINTQPELATLILRSPANNNIPAIRNLLMHNTQLQHLSVYNSDLQTLAELFTILQEQHNITALKITKTKLTAALLLNLNDLLKKNKYIIDLALEDNNFNSMAFEKLLVIIANATQVNSLSLLGNEFDQAALKILAPIIKTSNIKNLKLSVAKPKAENQKFLLELLQNSAINIQFNK